MYSFVSDLEAVLNQYAIQYTESIEADRFAISTDQMMADPGFTYDNKLLDVFIDDTNNILFIGLLRIPPTYRKQHLGYSIVEQLECWAKENGYTLFLDSCEESVPFWVRCGFEPICYQDGFHVMGFGDEDLKEKWKYGQCLFYDIH